MSIRTLTTTVAAVAMGLSLTACGGGQSVEDACKAANKRGTEAMSQLTSISPTDPEGSAKSLDKVNATLKSTIKDIDNEKVKKALTDLSDQFGQLSTQLSAIKDAGTDQAKLQEASAKLTTLGTNITQQAQKLNTLCS